MCLEIIPTNHASVRVRLLVLHEEASDCLEKRRRITVLANAHYDHVQRADDLKESAVITLKGSTKSIYN